jgi:hypothetical protein
MAKQRKKIMVYSSIDNLGGSMYLKYRLYVKKSLFMVVFLLPYVFFSCFAYGQNTDHENGVNRVYGIDHTTHKIMINDDSHSMLIGLKVYIYDLKTRKKQLVNRYALKKDQAVNFTPELRNGSSYLSEITILR